MLSYKTKRYINKSLLMYGIFALIGFTVLILGIFFNILRDEMLGICSGLIPTGVLGIILTLRMKNEPEKTEKMVRVKTEERLQFIRYKAGNFTFWVTFIYLTIAAVLSKHISISLPIFLSITIVAMAVLNIIVSQVYQKIS